MKKAVSILLTLIVGLSTLSISTTARAAGSASKAGVVATSSGRLNVRTGPSTSSAVTAYLNKGSYVTLLSQSGSWWRVEYGKQQYGYVHADYIRTLSSYTATVQTQSGNLNVRAGMGTSYAVSGKLAKGETLLVLSSSNGWSRVLYHGTKTGYVSSQYLKASGYAPLSLSLPSYKQTDSRWANVQIGNSGKTIAQIGCTTTAIAMMESYRQGKTIYPDAMSKQLSYSSSGDLYWPGDYQVVTSSSGYLQNLYHLLSSGKPVLFGVKKSSGRQHWVVVTGFTGGSSLSAAQFQILDPGSHSRTNLQQLLNEYPIFYKYFYYR